MIPMRQAAKMSDRFGTLIERHDTADFPYYNCIPVRISGLQWWFVMLMVALGFTALITLGSIFLGPLAGFIPAILFVAFPLAGLILVARGHWQAIFRRVSGRDILTMVVFAILNILVSSTVGAIVAQIFGAGANPEVNALAKGSAVDWIMFFPKTAIQLFGEELLTILPFLALMYLFVSMITLSRKAAILLAWGITALVFGLIHLPTYNWNVAQAVLIIGSARIVLTLAYIRTKNIWVSTGAHILNDWFLFTSTAFFAALNIAR
ncbi:MAG: hypothetical protein OJF49_001390 [Ktedonobacterales bacterium]|jgi:membrane protease YdiL (CAAX protease family)|nr:MAG: hypothetical protein OJF49_001390 [Ktedonobacterales bacterium]